MGQPGPSSTPIFKQGVIVWESDLCFHSLVRAKFSLWAEKAADGLQHLVGRRDYGHGPAPKLVTIWGLVLAFLARESFEPDEEGMGVDLTKRCTKILGQQRQPSKVCREVA